MWLIWPLPSQNLEINLFCNPHHAWNTHPLLFIKMSLGSKAQLKPCASCHFHPGFSSSSDVGPIASSTVALAGLYTTRVPGTQQCSINTNSLSLAPSYIIKISCFVTFHRMSYFLCLIYVLFLGEYYYFHPCAILNFARVQYLLREKPSHHCL